MRLPTPSASRNAGDRDRIELRQRHASAVVELGRDGVAVADSPQPALVLEEARELLVVDLDDLLVARAAVRARRRRLRAHRARRSRPAGIAFAPRRSISSRFWTCGAHGSLGRSSASGRPGIERVRARALGEPRVHVGAQARRATPPRTRARRRARATRARGRARPAGGCRAPAARGPSPARARARATISSGVPPSSSSSRSRSRPPRRRRVEHDAAADGRLGAQHDPVAACGDHRCDEPQLRVLAVARDPRRDARSCRCARSRPPAGRRVLVELDVEAVRDGVVAGRDEHVAAPSSLRSSVGRLTATRWPGSASLDGGVVHLDAAHAHDAARRLEAQQVAGGDAARPERPGRRPSRFPAG